LGRVPGEVLEKSGSVEKLIKELLRGKGLDYVHISMATIGDCYFAEYKGNYGSGVKLAVALKQLAVSMEK